MEDSKHVSKFGQLFFDLVDNLATLFPQCKVTTDIRSRLQQNPNELEAIRLDWARVIVPYKIQSFRPTGRYFEQVERDLPQHLFASLQLAARYKSMSGDRQAQDDLCSILADLEVFAMEDAPLIEEPESPESETKQTIQSRFDDPALHELCIQRTGNPDLVNEMKGLCLHIPYLNKIYENRTNEEIAEQMAMFQGILPLFVKMFKSGMPVEHVVDRFKLHRAKTKAMQNGASHQ